MFFCNKNFIFSSISQGFSLMTLINLSWTFRKVKIWTDKDEDMETHPKLTIDTNSAKIKIIPLALLSLKSLSFLSISILIIEFNSLLIAFTS